MIYIHCKTQQVELAYTEWGNGAAAMQVSPVNLFEQGPIKLIINTQKYTCSFTTRTNKIMLTDKTQTKAFLTKFQDSAIQKFNKYLFVYDKP